MGENNPDLMVASDLSNAMSDYSVDEEHLDSPTELKETTYLNHKWNEQYGYYKNIPELQGVIDTLATWTIGKGFTAPLVTEMLLSSIKGSGKDSFNSILENMIRTYHIGGDSFAEIIRDDEGVLINLKPLNPSKIKTVWDGKGMIKRYEQISNANKPTKKFKPEQILHFMRKRIGDEIHGQSMVNVLVPIILTRNEAIADYKISLHRFVKPRWIIKLDTDNSTKIASIKAKWDKANADGENMYIPMGSVEVEQMSVAPNSTLNPLAWIEAQNDYFYEAAKVPKIIVGNAKEFTDAAGKTSYLAFQQTIEEEQLYVEEQILSQLNLEIHLTFPASLEGDLLSDKAKDVQNGAIKPGEMQV